jgi:large subunit ribosomal protein L23
MDLNISNVILGPVLTDKAYKLNKKKQLVLKVNTHANKVLIRKALEALFDVKVKRVNIVVRKGKTTTVKNRTSVKPKIKIAYITLKDGYELNIFDAAQAAPVEKPSSALKSA